MQPYCVTLMSHERLEEVEDPMLNVATLHADVASTITAIKWGHDSHSLGVAMY